MVTRRAVRLLAVLLVAGALPSACDDNTPVCVPETVDDHCLCSTGDWGERRCKPDGLGYGRCECRGGEGGQGGDDNAGGTSATAGQPPVAGGGSGGTAGTDASGGTAGTDASGGHGEAPAGD
jgi:hypothetical protein